ncbi:hypothetical protein SAMN03159496_04862 [Rhizobium sp. NFR07]|jgi:hypothetical protein|uniref:hypothetical protein n=1 Tax=Rhizobium sp. NFR07 TaxID=1566262 RepID=UPI0008E9FC4B|nr:hypothetical protein [Rhizobium sp. NFR07]SFB54053.1 hypothetical protein SAMN03159496_04862 [Rhizobium sp. NFR07]
MQSFLQFCRRHLPPHPHARSLCRGSTIILGMCVLLGAATVITMLITHLSPTV